MPKWIDVADENALASGQMTAVEVGRQTLLIANIGGQICAAQDECTHRGGPLHEGSLAGDVVTCPWHGSRFNVKSGKVVAGPATEGLQTYPTRVENGKAQVELP